MEDTQRFIAAISKAQEHDAIDCDKVEAIWTRIKTDASFRDKFNYIDYAPLDMLNRSPTFLQCYSMYNLFSPVLSFLMPVIMLTTTDDPKEIEECYRLGCNVYVTKPVDAEVLLAKIAELVRSKDARHV